MMKTFILFSCIVAAVVAFPAQQNLPTPAVQTVVKNVIDAPITCPPNQQPDKNGRCREVWRISRAMDHIIVCPDGLTPHVIGLRCVPAGTDDKNVIDVPVVCKNGQKPDQNGKCRDEWAVRRGAEGKNVIDAPITCPPGYQLDKNGRCRQVWTLGQVDDKNVIDVPVVCPGGQKPDQNGKCRDEWVIFSQVDPQNVIDVPIVCPDGLKPDQNGRCREPWSYGRMRMVPREYLLRK